MIISAAVEFGEAIRTDAVGEVEAEFSIEERFGAFPDVVVIPDFFAIGADRDLAVLGFVFREQSDEFLNGHFVLLRLGFGGAEQGGVE